MGVSCLSQYPEVKVTENGSMKVLVTHEKVHSAKLQALRLQACWYLHEISLNDSFEYAIDI